MPYNVASDRCPPMHAKLGWSCIRFSFQRQARLRSTTKNDTRCCYNKIRTPNRLATQYSTVWIHYFGHPRAATSIVANSAGAATVLLHYSTTINTTVCCIPRCREGLRRPSHSTAISGGSHDASRSAVIANYHHHYIATVQYSPPNRLVTGRV